MTVIFYYYRYYHFLSIVKTRKYYTIYDEIRQIYVV